MRPPRLDDLRRGLDPWLAPIVAAGLALRLWGIDFGLPQPLCRPDEMQIAEEAFWLFRGELIPPGFIGYPTLFVYVLMALYAVYYLVGLASGRYESVVDLKVEYHADPSAFQLIGRSVSVLSGTATILAVYALARHVCDRSTARVAGLFLAFSYLHVRDSHFGTTDVTTTFLLTMSVLYLVRCLGARSLRPFVLAGVFAGLCASSKFVGVLMVVPLFAVHAMNLRAEGRAGRRFFDKRPLVFLAGLLLAFFAGTPGALVHPLQFVKTAFGEVGHLRGGHGGVEVSAAWRYHLSFSLYHGLGWCVLGAGLAGVFLIALRRPRMAIVLFAFPVLYFAIAASGSTAFVRYSIPLLPFLCVSAAYFVTTTAGALAGAVGRPRLAGALGTVLAVLCVLPSAALAVPLGGLLARKDTRVQAQEWIESNVAPGATLGMTASYGRVKLHMDAATLAEVRQSAWETDPTESNVLVPVLDARLRHQAERGIPGYAECQYLPDKDAFRGRRGLIEGLPDYVVLSESPLLQGRQITPTLRHHLSEEYEFVVGFGATDGRVVAESYDRLDAFFLPYAGFKGVQRPGPNLRIFRRKE